MSERLLNLLTMISTARQLAKDAEAERVLGMAQALCRRLLDEAQKEAGQ